MNFTWARLFRLWAGFPSRNKNESSRLLLLQHMPKNSICAEIGVWKGHFSQQILRIVEPRKLHLIDPWLFQPEFSDRMYGGSVAKNQEHMDNIYKDVTDKLGHLDNIIINRGKSSEILPVFPDGYFDWVYIDGNHYYQYVIHDLELCFLKVRTGGIIAGDDYYWGAHHKYPVQRAVVSFLERHHLENRLKLMASQFIIYL